MSDKPEPRWCLCHMLPKHIGHKVNLGKSKRELVLPDGKRVKEEDWRDKFKDADQDQRWWDAQ